RRHARPTVHVGLVGDRAQRAGRRVRPGRGGLDLVVPAGLPAPPVHERVVVESTRKRLVRPLEDEHRRGLSVELAPHPEAAGPPHIGDTVGPEVIRVLGENPVEPLGGGGGLVTNGEFENCVHGRPHFWGSVVTAEILPEKERPMLYVVSAPGRTYSISRVRSSVGGIPGTRRG